MTGEGVNTIIVQMFDGKGVVAWTHGNSGGRLLKQGGVRGLLWLIFAAYVPLACQSPYPIVVYSVVNYRPHFSHFWANM